MFCVISHALNGYHANVAAAEKRYEIFDGFEFPLHLSRFIDDPNSDPMTDDERQQWAEWVRDEIITDILCEYDCRLTPSRFPLVDDPSIKPTGNQEVVERVEEMLAGYLP